MMAPRDETPRVASGFGSQIVYLNSLTEELPLRNVGLKMAGGEVHHISR